MTPKEKAKELVDKLKDHVNPYIGSGMLSNTHDDSAILYQAKQCALIAVDEILKIFNLLEWDGNIKYWQQVRIEIENI